MPFGPRIERKIARPSPCGSLPDCYRRPAVCGKLRARTTSLFIQPVLSERLEEQSRCDGKVAWTKHLIDATGGVGLQVLIVDVNRDGKPDLVTSNKHDVFYFEQIPTGE